MKNVKTQFPLITDDVFRSCVENCSEAIMLTDSVGKLIYVNGAWQDIYGYSSAEVVGNTPRLLRSRHQDQAFYDAMWDEIRNPHKGRWSGELINKTKCGKEVPVHLTITAYTDEGGQIAGYMGIALNLTEKKQMLAQILHQDRLASVGMLASGLAHEVGTPLGVIRGRAEYIAMTSTDDTVKKGLTIITEQIDRISKLIYSLLNVARYERSEAVRSVRLEGVIQEVAALLSQKLRYANAELSINIAPLIVVMAEADRLQQVVLNLAVNAVHAIESAVSAGRNGPHKLTIESHDLGNEVELAIVDTGCGISEENMKHLFKPFFTTKDIGVGTGLGLAIAYQIVLSWNGEIKVESTEGVGTTFRLIFKKP